MLALAVGYAFCMDPSGAERGIIGNGAPPISSAEGRASGLRPAGPRDRNYVKDSRRARPDFTLGWARARPFGFDRDRGFGVCRSDGGNDHRISDSRRNDALRDHHGGGWEDLVRRQRPPCRRGLPSADGAGGALPLLPCRPASVLALAAAN